jgi:hypothetical protein
VSQLRLGPQFKAHFSTQINHTRNMMQYQEKYPILSQACGHTIGNLSSLDATNSNSLSELIEKI